MKKSIFPTNHDYRASDMNYCCRECTQQYSNWQNFYEEYKGADIDMNLVFRWDINETDIKGRYWMQIIIIAQRKGIYIPIIIDSVTKSDESQIIDFMKPHFHKIIKNWQPLSNKFLAP